MSVQTVENKFAVHGKNVFPFTQQVGSVVSKIPAGLYKIKQGMFGYFLAKECDNITLPEKIYGSTVERAHRIMSAYNSSKTSTGVGLFGKKGAGKSLLSSVIAQNAINNGLPVIDVSDSFDTDKDYLNFIDTLGNSVIIFDEFLKHLSKLNKSDENNSSDSEHAKRNQDKLLNFFQGVNTPKRLIVMIDNSSYSLSDFLLDRPGRMRYMFNFTGVESEVVQALASNAGLNEESIEQLVTYSAKYKPSFDVINAIIDEWVKYPEDSLTEITTILNVPTIRSHDTVKAKVLEFTPTTDNCTLENELTDFDYDTCGVYIKISLPNPYFLLDLPSEDDYDSTDLSNKIGYTTIIENHKNPVITVNKRVNSSELVGIKDNKYAYKHSMFTCVVEIQEIFTSSAQLNYFNPSM